MKKWEAPAITSLVLSETKNDEWIGKYPDEAFNDNIGPVPFTDSKGNTLYDIGTNDPEKAVNLHS